MLDKTISKYRVRDKQVHDIALTSNGSSEADARAAGENLQLETGNGMKREATLLHDEQEAEARIVSDLKSLHDEKKSLKSHFEAKSQSDQTEQITRKDQIMTAFAMLFMLFGTIAGMNTVQSGIVESGLFLIVAEMPWIAWLFSLSVPLAMGIFKFVDVTMGSTAVQRRYYGCLGGVAILSALTWLVGGMAVLLMPEVAEADMLASEAVIRATEEAAKQALAMRRIFFSSVQLLMETTGGALAFYYCTTIFDKYQRIRICKKLKVIDKLIAVKSKVLRKIRKRISKLEATIEKKKAAIEEAVLETKTRVNMEKFRMGLLDARPLIALLGFCAFTLAPERSLATDYVITVGNGFPETQTKQAAASLKAFYMKLAPGDSVQVFSGDANQLATFEMPSSRGYANAKIKGRYPEGRKFLKEIGRYLVTHQGKSGTIDFPRLAQKLGTLLPGKKETVLILGPAQYIAKEASFSMLPGDRHPSDFLIGVDENNIYETKTGRGKWLKNRKVHWWISQSLRERPMVEHDVKRVWYHYITQLGGKLVTIEDDLDTVVSRALQPEAASDLSFTPLDEKTPRRMLFSEDRTVEIDFDTPPSDPVELESAPVLEGKIRCGIRWPKGTSPQDADLWARMSGGPWAYFKEPTPEPGLRHWKDMLSSPAPQDMEVIEVESAKLADLEIFINYYSGEGEGPLKGQVVLMIGESSRYVGEWSIEATSGNKGAGDRTNDPHWVKVDLLKLVSE